MRVFSILTLLFISASAEADFRAGAAAVDISPPKLPVILNGMFEERIANVVTDPLHARGLVLDDGKTRLAIVIVDSCMLPRDLLDRAKDLIKQSTGIPPDHVLIAATHTHSAPAAMAALGARADPAYIEFLVPQLIRTVELANHNLAPAQIGWAVVHDPEHTALRRWIRRPDKMLNDPFGEKTVRANMHPGFMSPDAIGPSGPPDPGLSVLAVRSPAGRQFALLANYSMHYYGSAGVSADYFGRFADAIGKLVGTGGDGPPFVGIMSQGTSGDLYRVDYSRPQKPPDTIDEYAGAIARKAHEAYQSIRWHDSAPLAIRETKIALHRRTPSPERLEWAKKVVAEIKTPLPKGQRQVYAMEQFHLDRDPVRELKLQAIKIGELGIAAIPNEVFALSGLKIKAQSPLEPTFTIELANGSEGYIPPPEQHSLGGYTTWPARTAALEGQAEPKIVETVLNLLEDAAGKPRRKPVEPLDAYAKAVLESKPLAYWRLDEMGGDVAHDATGHGHDAKFEGGHAFYLDGPTRGNHAVHLAGGHLTATLPDKSDRYSIEMWLWNGLPTDARQITGIFTRYGGESIGLAGTVDGQLKANRLFVLGFGAPSPTRAGRSEIALRNWYHVACVRHGTKLALYLNGQRDIDGEFPVDNAIGEFVIGSGGSFGWEGKLDEVAVYDRSLTADEIARHFAAAKKDGAP
jgi:hypothetical protein